MVRAGRPGRGFQGDALFLPSSTIGRGLPRRRAPSSTRRVLGSPAPSDAAPPALCGSTSRLTHTPRLPPVYAPQPELPPNHATLASGWSPAFAGRDRPAGFLCKVSVMSSHVVLLTRALSGA